LILALAEGLSYREIEQRLGASAPTVSKWKSRFEESGIAGLQAQHRAASFSKRSSRLMRLDNSSFTACLAA
jgi:transposase